MQSRTRETILTFNLALGNYSELMSLVLVYFGSFLARFINHGDKHYINQITGVKLSEYHVLLNSLMSRLIYSVRFHIKINYDAFIFPFTWSTTSFLVYKKHCCIRNLGYSKII